MNLACALRKKSQEKKKKKRNVEVMDVDDWNHQRFEIAPGSLALRHDYWLWCIANTSTNLQWVGTGWN